MHLHGRLGNQMYEVFVTIAAAIESGQSFGFYVFSKTSDRVYWSTVFSELKPHLFGTAIQDSFTYKDHKFVYKPFYHLLNKWRSKVCVIDGYFQKVKYIEQHAKVITQFLKLDELRAQIYASWQHLLPTLGPGNNTVILHFRIGDYVKDPGIWPLMPLTYYKDALSVLVQKHPDVQNVLYFCEKKDVPVVNEKVATLSAEFPSVHFQKVPDGLDDYEEMFVMSLGQHHIIANSTFSFWGAYLKDICDDCDEEHRTVCYPSLQFGPKVSKRAYSLDNTFPSEWTLIQV